MPHLVESFWPGDAHRHGDKDVIRHIFPGVAGVLAVAWAAQVGAQPYAIDWHTTDAGGGNSGGRNYILWGAAGQPDAGLASPAIGGSYELAGGFWAFPGLTCTIYAPFDLDLDCDVDAADLLLFAACASGPELPKDAIPACTRADLDRDGDIDQEDFAGFQRCYSGAGRLADPDCGQ